MSGMYLCTAGEEPVHLPADVVCHCGQAKYRKLVRMFTNSWNGVMKALRGYDVYDTYLRLEICGHVTPFINDHQLLEDICQAFGVHFRCAAMAQEGEVRILSGECKCRRTGSKSYLRPFTISEKRVLEAAECYDRRMNMRRSKFVCSSNHVRGLIDDRETLENLREALGPETVYSIMYVNLLHEPARTHLLEHMRQGVKF